MCGYASLYACEKKGGKRDVAMVASQLGVLAIRGHIHRFGPVGGQLEAYPPDAANPCHQTSKPGLVPICRPPGPTRTWRSPLAYASSTRDGRKHPAQGLAAIAANRRSPEPALARGAIRESRWPPPARPSRWRSPPSRVCASHLGTGLGYSCTQVPRSPARPLLFSGDDQLEEWGSRRPARLGKARTDLF